MIDENKNNQPLDLSYLREMSGDSADFMIEMLDVFQKQTPIYIDDLLLDRENLQRIWVLRNHLADMNSQEAMELVQAQIKGTKSNEEFLMGMNG
jgi:transcription termination factor Rho